MPINFTIKSFNELSVQELYELLDLRTEVFVVEQDCVYNDMDYYDQKAFHVTGYLDDKLITCARIIPPGKKYKEASIGRVVVAKDYRGKNISAELMKVCIEYAQKQFNNSPIRIQAQAHLEKMYKRLGFITCTEPYLEIGIPHVEMVLEFSAA